VPVREGEREPVMCPGPHRLTTLRITSPLEIAHELA
jgi:hypothetical protein